jgi:hypothetical protein
MPHDYKYKIILGILAIIIFSQLDCKFNIIKQVEYLSYYWIFLMIVSQVLLVIYGIINNILVIYLIGIIILIGLSYILYIKLIFTYNSRIERELKDKNILK